MFHFEISFGNEVSSPEKPPEINKIMQTGTSQVKHFRQISAKEIFVLAEHLMRLPLKYLIIEMLEYKYVTLKWRSLSCT